MIKMVLIFSICNIFIKKMIREGNLFVKKVPTTYCKFGFSKVKSRSAKFSWPSQSMLPLQTCIFMRYQKLLFFKESIRTENTPRRYSCMKIRMPFLQKGCHSVVCLATFVKGPFCDVSICTSQQGDAAGNMAAAAEMCSGRETKKTAPKWVLQEI